MAKISGYDPDTVLDDNDYLVGVDSVSGRTKRFLGSVLRAGMASLAYIAAQKGAANGIAGLGADGKVPATQLPAPGSLSLPQTVIASVTAPANWLSAATYVCDGAADDVQIQAAYDALLLAGGGTIWLSPGTFNLAATLQFAGTNNVNTGVCIKMMAAGKKSTLLDAAPNVDAIHIKDIAIVDLADFEIGVHGSGAGLTSTSSAGAVHRSFWNSSFKNILISGDWATHTGWAINMGSPFRSVFENIEIGGVRNGIKFYSEYSDFNPGDSTLTRVFVELASAAAGVAYQLDSPTGLGSVNQLTFNVCEAIADVAGCTGILLTGATGSNHNRFWGTNVEQMAISVDCQTGEGNIFELDYTQPRTGGTFFHTGTAATNNTFSSTDAFVVAAGTLTLFHDENTANQLAPNRVINTKILADTGSTVTNSLVDGSVLRDVVYAGAGTVPTYIRHWQGKLRMVVGNSQSEGALEIVNDSSGGGGAVDTVYIHNNTNFAYANALLMLEQMNASDTGGMLRLKNHATASNTLQLEDASGIVRAIDNFGRIHPRTGTVASSATPAINTDTVDFFSITALAVAITSMTSGLTGTPIEGQKLIIAITGTAGRAITWGSKFEASTVALPTTTTSTTRLDVEFIWNTVTSKWRCVRVS